MPLLRRFLLLVLPAVFLLGGCASPQRRGEGPEWLQARRSLKEARRIRYSPAERAGLYLDAAQRSLKVMREDSGAARTQAQAIYNAAAAEVTALLRREEKLWKPEVMLPAPGVAGAYRLRVHPGNPREGYWNPMFFTAYEPADAVDYRGFRRRVMEPGLGGTLVGIRKTGEERTPKDPFAYRVGKSAPVTAVLAFGPKKAGLQPVTLTLADPARRTEAPLSGPAQPLAANFTAPLAWYPRRSEFWAGLMAMLKVQEYLGTTGLYMLEPYDPGRVPVLFIHGLASTPQMWLNVINEIESDPELRRRCQYWVYWYPTGNPLAYSAFRLREDLATVQRLYGLPNGCVVVGHSMGGLLAQMQSVESGRALWDRVFTKKAESLYASLPENDLFKRALIFKRNPAIRRLVFICVPHRGSELATGRLGNFASSLISLPLMVLDGAHEALGQSINLLTGKTGRFPTSIQSLSPHSPLLAGLDALPIRAPYHSIIGDRGRRDTPQSSDGVVPYRSSHMAGAQSELIVPGPHGSYELPETVEELKRILRIEIKVRPLPLVKAR